MTSSGGAGDVRFEDHAEFAHVKGEIIPSRRQDCRISMLSTHVDGKITTHRCPKTLSCRASCSASMLPGKEAERAQVSRLGETKRDMLTLPSHSDKPRCRRMPAGMSTTMRSATWSARWTRTLFGGEVGHGEDNDLARDNLVGVIAAE
ncbi:hypothetical protein CGK93_10560 [Arthrobacter sp. YN]|nr:hypothetical protein CGK93_10560 [Arthrobacter sp. YN]